MEHSISGNPALGPELRMLLMLEKMKFSVVIHWLSFSYVIGLSAQLPYVFVVALFVCFFQIVGGSAKYLCKEFTTSLSLSRPLIFYLRKWKHKNMK